MTMIKTAVANDGRVLPVLEKDYKKLYEELKQKQQLKDENYRRNQLRKETQDNTGFGGTTRYTSFKQRRKEENQKQQTKEKKALAQQQVKRSAIVSGYIGPEPTDSTFDSRIHGLLAPPKTRNLLNGKYID